jgi:hypothetical protein
MPQINNTVVPTDAQIASPKAMPHPRTRVPVTNRAFKQVLDTVGRHSLGRRRIIMARTRSPS